EHILLTLPMTALALSVLTFFSTALGGLFALRRRGQLYLVMGFSAGVLVAAALVHLLPDALELMSEPHEQAHVFLAAALGFLAYYSLDFFVHLGAAGHEHRHAPGECQTHQRSAGDATFGSIAALGLT